MRPGCLLLLLIWTITGCTKKSLPVPPVVPPVDSVSAEHAIAPGDSVSYLALGDSYTYGVGAAADQSFPFQLAAKLRGVGYLAGAPGVIAFDGWTAGDLLAALSSRNLNSKFDIITILIGVNDQNKGTGMAQYTSEMDQILSKAVSYAGGHSNRVFVISIPDWWVTPFAAGMNTTQIMNGVAQYNAVNQLEAGKFGATYIDITTISDKAATDPALTSNDGLHPSAQGYALWVSQLYGPVTTSFK